MYIHKSIKGYLKDLAAKMPAPGGGSAAALASAMAASLVSMAGHYTIGKERYKAFQTRAEKILARSLKIQKRLAELVDEDVKAYAKKDLRKAICVPMEVCFLSHELAKFGEEFVQHGNRNLMTDAALAVILSETSFVASLFYIKVNLKFLKGKTKKYVHMVRRLKPLLNKIKQIRKKVEVNVGYAIGR